MGYACGLLLDRNMVYNIRKKPGGCFMRSELDFCEGWLFHLGELPAGNPAAKGPMYLQAKTERRRMGPAARDYDDYSENYAEEGLITADAWEKVCLPHDYIISQRPRPENNGSQGYFQYENAWYRRHFFADPDWREKRVRLLFEGVATHCTVYLNGCRLGANFCGYHSFEFDLTDLLDYEKENVLAVHVDSSEHEGWWYQGAGIYRPVRLVITEPVHVETWGVFLHPEKQTEEIWRLPAEVEIVNDGFRGALLRVETAVFAPDGAPAAILSGEIVVPARDKATLRLFGQVHCPEIWDLDTPRLYTARTRLYEGETLLDEVSDRFGFRTLGWSEEGFFLNGRRVELKGVCCHQDFGLTGKAVPPRVQRYRLELMKEMGANAYRTAHYPHHAYTMDVADEIGMLVMDETRWFESTQEGMAQLRMLIRRDRNHPSVIFWSVGNEEPLHLTDRGRRIARSMLFEARRLDPTREVTTAVSHDPHRCPVMDSVDIIGVNYNLDSYDQLHALYPHKPIIASECCATGTTRGWYWAEDAARGYLPAYDRDTNKSFLGRERTWRFLRERKWIAGGFQWAGIEHRGETVWPRLCSQSGAVDLFLNRKDAFYQNQSLWLEKPMVHLLPHWNLPGREGEPIQVVAYTNCPRVELLVNGISQGIQAIDSCGHGQWQVEYHPGAIEAVAYAGDGTVAARERVETTGAPVRLRLRTLTPAPRPDGKDVLLLNCDCLDAQGRPVPDASPMVHFVTNELGRVLATGSDVSDHTPVTSPDRKMRAGLISLLIGAGEKKGILRVYAYADGLEGARLDVML